MITTEILKEFLGWCTVLNIGIFMSAVIATIVLRAKILPIHAQMFSLSEQEISQAYFNYLGKYKIAIIMFNIVPYCALLIMG